MNVLVFKTDVSSPSIGKKLISELMTVLPIIKATIDMEDIDRVLRLESHQLQVETVVHTVEQLGINCKEMTW